MITFLKIISFPFRLIIFILLAVLSAVFSGIRTFEKFLIKHNAVFLFSTIIILMTALFTIYLLIRMVCNIFNSDFALLLKDAFGLGLCWLFSLLGAYLSDFFEYVSIISEKLWRRAKKVLFIAVEKERVDI